MPTNNLKSPNIKVSFVIINYNGKELLEQCLSSILRSVNNSTSFEVIVVDDASTDGSAEMVRKKFSSVHLIVNEKESFWNVCLNKAIKAAKEEYIYFLMPDTLLTSGTVEKLLEFMEQRIDVSAVTCKTTYPDGRFQQNATRDNNLKEFFLNYTFLGKIFPLWKKKIHDDYTYAGYNWEQNHEIENAGLTNMLVRRDIIDKIGLIDLSMLYFSENDFCMRIRKNGDKIYYLAEGNVIHHLRGVVKKLNIKKIAKVYENDLFQFVKKYYGSLIAWMLRILVWISNLLLSLRERKPMRLLERFLVEPEKHT